MIRDTCVGHRPVDARNAWVTCEGLIPAMAAGTLGRPGGLAAAGIFADGGRTTR
ncbi:hypothetical protein BCL76_104165 [Streptomyces sp. CG 926]|uniref:hypothetical protein n=1 Tax=Streptomyces sp. CG 926 TaxID=1882405 RepID=UPI000D797BF3|nr:hypothetical protein [Streptomyces sp. CG 926]PWK71060.1 hypothetical protein BCL76_104165 [Streptomyces sp. CG 926]